MACGLQACTPTQVPQLPVVAWPRLWSARRPAATAGACATAPRRANRPVGW